MKLTDFLKADAVLPDLAGRSAPEVLAELCRPVAAQHGLDAARLLQTLLDRERLGSTSVGEGVAIPHGRLAGLPALTATLGRAPAGVEFRAVDGKPVRLFRSQAFREAILAAPDAPAILRLVEVEDARE